MADREDFAAAVGARIAGRSKIGHTHAWPDITEKPAAPGALKVVPLALTTGWGGEDQPLERSVRIPFQFNAPLGRWRVHVQNWNPRTGATRGQVDVTGLWIGDDNGLGGFKTSPLNLQGAFSTPADGSAWTSPWFDAPIGDGVPRLLAFGYTSAAAPQGMAGGSYQFGTADRAGDMTNPVAGPFRATPLDWWIEAETPVTTPVIAGFGDSLTSGVGATFPVHESWVSQYARAHNALPYHSSHGGDSMWSIVNGGRQVDRWAHLARADAVVWAMGSNDLNSRTIAQLQDNYATVRPLVERNVGPVRYAATVQPRAAWDAAKEATREEWNTWLNTQDFREVFDFAAVVSADGDTILPEYNYDGTHLNTAGYAAEAASITTPLTAPGGDIGTLTARVEKLEVGSGVHDLTAMFSLASGAAYLEVRDGSVWLHFLGATLSGSGNVDLTASGLTSVAPVSPITSVNLDLIAGADTTRRLQVNEFGYVRVFGYVAGEVLNGAVSYPMSRPAPAVWPGVKV